MSGDISREHWMVPVHGLARADPDGIVALVACRDGSVTLHLTCAGTQGTVRLNISRAAQLSTGIWEAAGVSQQLTKPLDNWPSSPPPPRPSPGSGEPASNLVTTPPPIVYRPRPTAPGPRRGIGLGE